MDYPVRTLSQLRPILQGFRKTAGLTQAGMASRLGVTQQTYAQLEANPAAVSVERLFKVLRLLNVDLTLGYTATPAAQSGNAVGRIASVRATKTAAPGTTTPAKKVSRRDPHTITPGTTRRTGKQPAAPAAQSRGRSAVKQATAAKASGARKSQATTARKAASISKKKEHW